MLVLTWLIFTLYDGRNEEGQDKKQNDGKGVQEGSKVHGFLERVHAFMIACNAMHTMLCMHVTVCTYP